MDRISINEFVVVPVPGDSETKISIKKFVESKSLTFSKGSGYYQLSKPETIQPNKQVLVQRLSDPVIIIGGKSVREVLGIDTTGKNSTKKYEIDDEILKEFKVFVQSTSYNRNLIGGTVFLYRKEEVDPTSASTASSDPSPSKRSRRSSPPAPPPTAATPLITNISTPKKAPSGTAATDQVEIVFSFDTTGSMYPCLSTVRSVIRDTLNRLTTHIPNIRIGIIAHGDYCDRSSTYVTKAANDYKLCGAKDIGKLIEFVTNVSSTGGGDFPECYELVLQEVGRKFNWSDGANKSLVMIGDAPPHEVNANPGKIDWRNEAWDLKQKGIRVYAVQALGYTQSEMFYAEVARITMGFHLRLHQLSSITDFLVAVCFREGDNADSHSEMGRLAQFEEEVTSSGRMVNNLRQLFDQLQGRAPTLTSSAATTGGGGSSSGLKPVSPSRFQILTVDEDKSIKEFAEARGLVFKVGRGFYEFTKPESISDKKEIVLMDKITGDFYTGWAAAREFSGIIPGKSGKQSPKDVDKYIVFVQSSSYNRKLIAGHKFLYEVDSSR